MSPDEILKALRAEMIAASERAKVASERFDETLRDPPRGIAHRNRVQLICAAAREYSIARWDLMETLKKINDYTILGIFFRKTSNTRRPRIG